MSKKVKHHPNLRFIHAVVEDKEQPRKTPAWLRRSLELMRKLKLEGVAF
jgi:hypothetical protein